MRLECPGQVADHDAVWRWRRRELRRIKTVYEYKPVRRDLVEQKTFKGAGVYPFMAVLEHGFERKPGYGSDIRETPVLVVDGREALFGKTRHTGFAQRE